jgi:hypothetical protein
METAYISAFAALGGSAVGALASFMTTWLTLNSQERANRWAREISRRETLYGEFIEEASKLYSDSLMNQAEEPTKFVRIYALSNKLRLFSSAEVLVKVEDVMKRLIQVYENPAQDFDWVSKAKDLGKADILRSFSEACRRDLDL